MLAPPEVLEELKQTDRIAFYSIDLISYFAMRQTELRLVIRLSHQVFFYNTREQTLFMMYSYVYSFMKSFRTVNDLGLRTTSDIN